MNPFDTNQWYQITSPKFDDRSLVGPKTGGLGGKEQVFFKLTKDTSDGKLWQLFPTDNGTYILRTKAAKTNAYLALQLNAEPNDPPRDGVAIMRDVHGASDEVFWKLNRFANGGYSFENIANGTGWRLYAQDYENLTMTNDLSERDDRKFQLTPWTEAGSINDPAFSTIKLPSGSTATVPGLSHSIASPSGSMTVTHSQSKAPSQSPTQDPAQDTPQKQPSSGGMSSGTQIAIGVSVGVGVFVLVAVILGIVFLLRRRRSKQTMVAKSGGSSSELDSTLSYSEMSPVPAGQGMSMQKYHMRELPADVPVPELDSQERILDRKR